MAGDNTEALDQVAEAVDRSDLTDEDVEELRALLEKLDDELDAYLPARRESRRLGRA